MILTPDAIETIKALVLCEVGNLEPIRTVSVESLDREKALLMFSEEIKKMGFRCDEYASEIIEIVISTWKKIDNSIRQLECQTPGLCRRYPAWRLTRRGYRAAPRQDWYARWTAAGNFIKWQGACMSDLVALKDSPIWQALGDGAGGFTDTWGNPYPPFAIDSGMGWISVNADEAHVLGLI